MPNKHAVGMAGQQTAEQFLLEKGLHILARNYRLRTGEIDLVARDGTYIVFIEVKYRTSLSHGYPREAVGYAKQSQIIRTAMQYITRYQLADADFRFDVVEVLAQGGQMRVNHIIDAFSA